MRTSKWLGMLVLGFLFSGVLAAGSARADDGYSDAELDRLLAPIALYPDSVLSHVLIASTYPLEVVQAARWSRAHPDLSGEEAVEAAEDEDWDPSVTALVAFPEVLARMDEDLEWTEQLGAAFRQQEGEVMDRVQVLRRRAYEAGRLEAVDNVRVIREREIIYIEPAVRNVVYVPYYDPWYVYGSWWWPDYPPYCWRTWYGRPVTYYGSGFYWGIGFHVAPRFYFTSFYWPQRYVVVVHDHHRSHRPIYSGRDVQSHSTEVRRWRHDERRYAPAPRREPRAIGSGPEQRYRGAQPASPARSAPEERREHREQRHERPAASSRPEAPARQQAPRPERSEAADRPRAARQGAHDDAARQGRPPERPAEDRPERKERATPTAPQGRAFRGEPRPAPRSAPEAVGGRSSAPEPESRRGPPRDREERAPPQAARERASAPRSEGRGNARQARER